MMDYELWKFIQSNLNQLHAEQGIQEFEEIDYCSLEALHLLQQAAECNDVKSLVCLGLYYQYGIVCAEEEHKAFLCYQQAAEGDCAWADLLLGQCYDMGIGINTIDESKALECYQKAAHKGSLDGGICMAINLIMQ